LYVQLDRFLVQNTADRLERVAQAALTRGPGYEHGERREPGRRPDRSDSTITYLLRDLSAPDVTVAVLSQAGEVLSVTTRFDSGEAEAGILSLLPAGWREQIPAGTGSEGATAVMGQWVVPATDSGRRLVVVQTIPDGPGPGNSPARLLLQAASLDTADATLDWVRLYLILGVLIGSVVGVLAGLALTRAVLRPLDRMARTAEAIAGGDLSRRLRLPPGGNEVTRLGSAFDHMVDRLAATLQAQRRFIADASHELRTPLTSLEGLSEMLLIGADRGDSRTIQRMARAMHGELGRMGRLVADLLTLSRLDSAAPLAVTSIEAGKLLDNVAEQVAPVAQARQIHLEVAHNGPLMVRADPDRLKQVILNLVDNALRYSPPEGAVHLTAAPDESSGRVRLQVRDSGPGIAPADLPRIFDRFYRGDPSRARASGNTGLGLAIAYGIIQAHGGTIEVQSAPGAGATFTVLLPAEPRDGRRTTDDGR
jgi:signal transduction histidine kinase